MATGPNWDAPGATVGLWKLNFKMNTPTRGFNLGFHIAEKAEADAISAGVKIAKHLKAILPGSVEIVFATVSKDGTKKDSRFIRGATGPGLFVNAAPPTPTTYDFSQTALLVRLEHSDGASVSMKFGPIPDDVITDELVVDALADVVNFAGPEPVDPAVFTVWKDNYLTLMQVLIGRTNFVKADHLPGKTYEYFSWQSAFALRVVRKKGGRVFI